MREQRLAGPTQLLPRIRASRWWRVCLALFLCLACSSSLAQTTRRRASAQTRRSGAHSTIPRDVFTAADRRVVEHAIGATCAERIRDPFGSMPIDEMQSRPSLAVNNPDAIAGARRAERLLPTTRRLVTGAIIELARQYDLYGNAAARTRVS